MSKDKHKNAVAQFWESRTGWQKLKKSLLLEELPGGSRWAAAFGSLLLFTFALQMITGILLAMSYSPSVASAWPSVKHIQEGMPLGEFIRSLHHWGSSVMVMLLLCHLMQVFIWGAYKKPREMTWMVGVLLLLLVLGMAFTGYLLPWDNKSYWASKVGLGIISTVPLIGDWIRTVLQGGPTIGNLTLTRFFTIHGFILPGLIITIVVVHLYLFRLHTVTPPWWESKARLRREAEPFWPGQVWKDALLACLLLIGLGIWCLYHPAPLGAEADPSQPYQARPEWYFMFLFQLLRYFKGPYEVVGTFVMPFTFFIVLFFWPFIDRNPHHDPRKRPFAISLLSLGTVGLVGLTIYANLADVRMQVPKISEKSPPLASAGQLQKVDVATLYSDNCVGCHGQNGKGEVMRAALKTIPDFTDSAWQAKQTDDDLKNRIIDGKMPQMPPFGDKLNSNQIDALVHYVRAFEKQANTSNSSSSSSDSTKSSH